MFSTATGTGSAPKGGISPASSADMGVGVAAAGIGSASLVIAGADGAILTGLEAFAPEVDGTLSTWSEPTGGEEGTATIGTTGTLSILTSTELDSLTDRSVASSLAKEAGDEIAKDAVGSPRKVT